MQIEVANFIIINIISNNWLIMALIMLRSDVKDSSTLLGVSSCLGVDVDLCFTGLFIIADNAVICSESGRGECMCVCVCVCVFSKLQLFLIVE